MTDQRVGGYEVVRPLARGGMAMVFLVHQPALDRQVVLKRLELDTADPRVAQRFVQEARLAARLDHPNIVTLFDFFEDGGVPYIAMEYVPGGSLRPLVGALSLPQVLGVAEGMLAGLRHAESRGIAHRDLKPENVLLTGQGGVKIADFGIARAYNALTGRLTSTGIAVGTPAYMAPEQAQDEPIGPATDLYAMGVIVYELVAGRPPFEADTPVAVLYSHVHRPPPPLTPASPALRGWVEWLLAKEPADRPHSAAAAWEALEEIAVDELGPYWRRDSPIFAPTARTAVLPPGATTAAAPPRPRGRRRLARGLAAGAVVAAAGAAGVLLALDGDEVPDSAARAPAPSSLPYDFDGDGRQALVAAFVEGSTPGVEPRSGAVLLREGGRWRTITQADAGVPGAPRRGDAFGSGVASGDFDGDGRSDLAIGTPGKDHVSVLFGPLDGGRRRQQLEAPGRLPGGAGRYGWNLLAEDLDRDGRDDLVVAAPGGTSDAPGTGAVHIRFGDAGRLRGGGSILAPPDAGMRGFGTRLRAGDVDADGHVDLVEGMPTTAVVEGHGNYCAGSPAGPAECRPLGGGATSSLAVADVDDDGRDDIVQGDAQRDAVVGETLFAGEVRLWLGGAEGPREPPVTITQETPDVPDRSEAGDEFGSVVEAGDVDGDGTADMIVAAGGEDDDAGRIFVIRGGAGGLAGTGHSAFDQSYDDVPGSARAESRFGSTMTLLRFSDDDRPDLAVAARGGERGERIMVVHGGPGIFAPGETETRTLPDTSEHVRARRFGAIRLARG